MTSAVALLDAASVTAKAPGDEAVGANQNSAVALDAERCEVLENRAAKAGRFGSKRLRSGMPRRARRREKYEIAIEQIERRNPFAVTQDRPMGRACAGRPRETCA